ncbi:hypothetical protein BBK36DRAFT_143995 [Trichoderma citrinoviride]|uniref:2EXR domain-containing protein n=1 Tax=Trichoderma citrinoviride TaxID=58853 RepID=A0A2T4B3H7_9HYPO|nr:hypothetical protein BBK36DRAFT_143995 [Trichoderma citrinoviride]PTB63751.1 hypothetical protein BBK36DRAFT_143995 [Trichoderma citrinoviride]
MEEQSMAFHPFALLPVELRLAIWFHCLPHRVVQKDNPFEITRLREEHKCWSIRPSLKNAAPPRIASVCRESRQVAMEWGKMVSQNHSWNLGPIWIQPRLDSYHLNFTPEAAWSSGYDIENIRDFLIEGWNWLDAVPISVAAEYFFEFDLEGRDLSMMRSTPYIEIKDDLVDEDLNILYSEWAYNYSRPFTKVSLSATMAFISVHVAKRHAIASGLFGLLLDAPVQLVNFDDEQRIRAFRALFERDSFNRKRPEMIKLFSLILSSTFRSRVEAWREKVDWLMMANAWLRAKMNWENCIPFDEDPSSAWIPITEEFQDRRRIVYMRNEHDGYENLFDNNNPWVIQARKELPRVAPKVLFLLCTDDCDVGGNLAMVPPIPRRSNRDDFFEVNHYEDL